MAIPRFDRRHFLSVSMISAGAVILGGNNWPLTRPQEVGSAIPRWSDPETWGGRLPGPDEWISLDRTVLLDTDVEVRGLAIQHGGALVFDPHSSCTLTSTANVVVLGLLQMRPASSAVNHTIRFVGVDEASFVGGGMTPLDTDVGLWCLGRGALDLAGSTRRAWARTDSSIPSGTQSITLQTDPIGWQPGDELAIVPTAGPSTSGLHDRYDYATITSISGRMVTLSTPTSHDHPTVDVGRGIVLAPEILNLTRNVNIEGTSDGRAHIFVMTERPQNMAYFRARWLGPRQVDGSTTKSVLGRYGLHFHMGGNATRGSEIEGAVLRDLGSQAYVVHASHGVTLTSCISHDTIGDAYWWDSPRDRWDRANDSHDVVYESCVASSVRTAGRGLRLCGFNMKQGVGNAARNCVAVGVQGNRQAAGFNWPEGHDGVWEFTGCVAHNNRVNGIFTWQNNKNRHVVENFVCYHNGKAGIEHGAYVTAYTYRNGYLYKNGGPAIILHSNSHSISNSEIAQQFVGLQCECVSQHAVEIERHRIVSGRATEFTGCTFNGQSHAAIAMVYGGDKTTAELFDIVDCTSSSPMLWLRNDTPPASVIRIQDTNGAIAASPVGTSGTFREDWNAMSTAVEPFSDETAAPGHVSITHGAPLNSASSPESPPPVTSTTTPPESTSSTTTTIANSPDETVTTPTEPESTSTTSTTTTTTTAPEQTTEEDPVLDRPAKSNGKATRTDDPKPGGKAKGRWG